MKNLYLEIKTDSPKATELINQIAKFHLSYNLFTDFSEQAKLITELLDLGYHNEGNACLLIMSKELEKYNPVLKPWLAIICKGIHENIH